jgi:hypothetical protein
MSTGKDLPAETFDADTVNMTFAAKVVSALTNKTEKILMVAPEKLLPLPGFNVRVKNEAYDERVSAIADSIVANGFYSHKPLGGLLLDSDHDHLFIHDGGHRLDAIPLAIERGATIAAVPVAVAPQGTTVEDLTVSLVQSNTGEPLSPVEMGAVVKRLLSYGMEKDEIARRIGKTTRHLDNLLVLAGAPITVRTAVADGKIAAAEAVKLVRKDPKTAASKVADAVKKAEDAGKAKATPKTMQGPKMQRIPYTVSLATGDKLGDALKAIATHVRSPVDHNPDATDALKEDGKLTIVVEILAPVPVAKPKPAPKKAAAKPKAAAKAIAAPADPDAAFDAAPAAKKPAAKKTGAKAAAKPAGAKKAASATKTPAKAAAPSTADKAAALAHTGATPVEDENAGL